MKLSQVLAISRDVKTRANAELTDLHRLVQKADPVSGHSRTYTPEDDEGERFPPESKIVQVRVEQDILPRVASLLTRLYDVECTKEYGNVNPAVRADVVVDGQTILDHVPAPALLFLEKRLQDVRTFIDKLPTLDPTEEWHPNVNTGYWASEPTETARSKKIQKNHELAPADEHHPAQVQVFTEDVKVGTWRTVKFSGAVPVRRKEELRRRVDRLTEEVKKAREEANTHDIPEVEVGDRVFGYLFAP